MKRKSLWQRCGFSRGGGHKQILLTAEKIETFIIRQPGGRVNVWCAGCGEAIEGLTVEQAVALTGLSARHVFRLVEADDIHFCETDAGLLFICPNSVASLVQF